MTTLLTSRNNSANPGVYVLTSASGKQYVGSSTNVRRRLYTHRTALRTNKHYNPRLQAAYEKHKDFKLQYCELPVKHIAEFEQLAYDMLQPRYNQSSDTSCSMHDEAIRAKCIATKNTPEALAKRSQQSKAMWDGSDRAKAQRANIDAALATPETKARMSAAMKACWQDPAYVTKVLAAREAAKTPETKARHLEATRIASQKPEYRAKMSSLMKAQASTPEAKAKRSAAAKEVGARPEVKSARRAALALRKTGPDGRLLKETTC